MKAVFIFSLAILATTSTKLGAQERGNAIYGDNGVYGYNNGYYYNQQANQPRNNSYYLPNDSVYTVSTRVMINLLPDVYVAVYSVQQEALTVPECNKLITARIDKFKNSLKALGISDENMFVDMIAQTRIYDYKISGNTASEEKQGFEFKKNVIIQFTEHAMLEKINMLAAEQEIYDIVKVDYIINDLEKVENQLREAAMKVIDNKKRFALENSSLQLPDNGLIMYENFNTVYPQEAYRQYTASESATVQPRYYNSDSWVKEQRKSKTFYFEKLNPALFDKVINPGMVRIPVQMSLDIAVKYYIGKPQVRRRK